MQVISSGRTSSVCRCFHHALCDDIDGDKQTSVAIKFLRDKAKAFQEISNMLMLGHPNVICALDIVETDDCVGIVMPLMRMDLRVFMQRVPYVAAGMRQIKIQASRAVHHIHTRGIIHMDIKPENVCVDFASKHGEINGVDPDFAIHCKLVDFGSCLSTGNIFMQRARQSECTASPTNVVVVQTTKGYQPPELMSNNGFISFAGDIYSMGIVFNELIDNLDPSTPECDVQLNAFRQLSSDMRQEDFRRRPSSLEVLKRLNDSDAMIPLIQTISSTPAWASQITNILIADSRKREKCFTAALINDQSNDLQRLVTLVRSPDSCHIQDAFWMLYEVSVDEAGGHYAGEASVVSVLSYFDRLAQTSNVCGLFYAKSLDVLSHMPHFFLSEEMIFCLWKISTSSYACERPLIRCLSNCWSETLREWCIGGEKLWGKKKEPFHVFVSRFKDDWDVQCEAAARRLVG